MAYTGQPVPSTVTSISQIKVSDGKSVEVTVPAGSGTVAGNFYMLDGFFGVVLKTIKAEENTAGETVALQLEACEYVTDQIDTKQAFVKGADLYFDTKNNVFTDQEVEGYLVGKVTVAKGAADTIQFIRYQKVTDEPAAKVSQGA